MSDAPIEDTTPTLVVNEEDFDVIPTRGQVNAARAVTGLTVLVALAALAAIAYRSAFVVEPTTAIVVTADETYDGAEVVVAPDRYPPGEPVGTAVLSAENAYKTPILLHPGGYVVTVTRKDRVVLKKDFFVEPFLGKEFFLGKPAAAIEAARTQPSARPGTR